MADDEIRERVPEDVEREISDIIDLRRDFANFRSEVRANLQLITHELNNLRHIVLLDRQRAEMRRKGGLTWETPISGANRERGGTIGPWCDHVSVTGSSSASATTWWTRGLSVATRTTICATYSIADPARG